MEVDRSLDCTEGAPLATRTYAIILAGGRGSRLGGLTAHRAKPALAFGGGNRLIDFPLSNCLHSGIHRIGVVTQYKADSLIRHLRESWDIKAPRLGASLDLLPAQQQIGEAWYRGTADAVFQNLHAIRRSGAAFVLVLAGDHVYRMNYARLVADHAASGAEVTVACMAVPLAEASGFGVMAVDARQRIVRFVEKPRSPDPLPNDPNRALASMGIYVFDAGFLLRELEHDQARTGSSHDFGNDLIPSLVGRARIFAHSYGRSAIGAPFWRDVGTLDSYWTASMELTGACPALALDDPHWPIWGEALPARPIRLCRDLAGRESVAHDCVLAGGSRLHGAVAERSILSAGVRLESGCQVADSVLLPGVAVGAGAVLRKVVVERGCQVPAGARIGRNPATDRRWFAVSPGGITLVTPEALAHFAAAELGSLAA